MFHIFKKEEKINRIKNRMQTKTNDVAWLVVSTHLGTGPQRKDVLTVVLKHLVSGPLHS